MSLRSRATPTERQRALARVTDPFPPPPARAASKKQSACLGPDLLCKGGKVCGTWWTKRSSPPSVGVMKPKPFVELNHLTVPVALLPSAIALADTLRPRAYRGWRCLRAGRRVLLLETA